MLGTKRRVVETVFALCFGLASVSAAATVAASPSSEAPATPSAHYLPALEGLATADEQSAYSEFLKGLIENPPQEPSAMVAATEMTLAKLRQPTKLRGFLQLMRAEALMGLERDADAVVAIDESITLLPDYSAPLILGSGIYTYANRIPQAADLLLRATEKDPQSVRLIDDYEVTSLLHRLSLANEDRRVRRLSDRLLSIGWIGDRVGSQSSLALEVIKGRVKDGDFAGARAVVPKLLIPKQSRELLMMNVFRPIWPDVEAWAGATLERQWPIYLEQSRERWLASKDALAAQDYTQALDAAGHDKTLIDEMLPLFETAKPTEDYYLIFVVAPLARALGRQGRWADANALFARAQEIWPVGSEANALNIIANSGRSLFFEGRPADSLKQTDAAIADARKWGPQVNADALAAMHHYRACALHELGRDAEAEVSMAIAAAGESADDIALMQLCLENSGEARSALLRGLQDESQRDAVLAFVQPNDDRISDSSYARKLHQRVVRLRNDPALLKALAKFGRVLPFRLNQSAPAERAAPSQR